MGASRCAPAPWLGRRSSVLNATIDRYAYAIIKTIDEPRVRFVATEQQEGCIAHPVAVTALRPPYTGSAFSLETDYLPVAVTRTRFDLYASTGKFIDIGIPEEYDRAQTELAGLISMSERSIS